MYMHTYIYKYMRTKVLHCYFEAKFNEVELMHIHNHIIIIYNVCHRGIVAWEGWLAGWRAGWLRVTVSV